MLQAATVRNKVAARGHCMNSCSGKYEIFASKLLFALFLLNIHATKSIQRTDVPFPLVRYKCAILYQMQERCLLDNILYDPSGSLCCSILHKLV